MQTHVAATLSMVLASVAGAAVDEDWVSTGGPPGGSIDVIASSQTRTLAGGGSLFLSDSAGDAWSSIGAAPARPTFAAAANETFYIATHDARVFKTGGTGGAFAASPGTQSISFLAADGDELYAIASDVGSFNGGSLFVSDDGAGSWSEVTTPNTIGAVYKDGDVILAHIFSTIELVRSDDGGKTWETIGVNAGLPQLAFGFSFVGEGDSIYASIASYTGLSEVFVSRDLGQTWESLGPGMTARAVIDMELSEHHIYAVATDASRTAIDIWRAPREGGAWTLVGDDVFSSSFVASGDMTVVGERLLLATSGAGVLMSDDGGFNWVAANSGLAGTTASAMSGAEDELLLTTGRAGEMWRFASGQWSAIAFPSALGDIRSVAAVAPSTFLAGTEAAGVRLSTDGGRTWSPANSGVPMYESIGGNKLREFDAFASRGGTWVGAGGPGLEWPPIGGGRAAVETGGGGVIRSTDGGSTWQRFTTGLPVIDIGMGGDPHYPAALSLIATEDGFLMGTKGHGVYRSISNGRTWIAGNTGIPTSVASLGGRAPIAALGEFGGALYAGTYAADVGQTLFRSESGDVWSPVAGLPHAQTNALAVHDGVLYAGLGRYLSGTSEGEGAGVWSSADGVSWEPVGEAIADRVITALSVQDGSLLAAASGGGVWVLEGTCRPDLDGDGHLTVFDFLAFQDLFVAGDPRADFTGDGVLDIFDFLAFQDEFTAGCD